MIPMPMVSDDRVPNAIKVPADLMPPSILGPNFQQRKPRSFKTRSRPGYLIMPETSKVGDGRLEWMVACKTFFEVLRVQQRTIYFALLRHKTSHQRLIVLMHLLRHKHLSQFRSDLRRFCHQHDPCRGTIQPMDRIQKLLKLISEDLQKNRLLPGRARTAVDDHPSRLKNSDDIIVLIHDLDRLA
jgi:hypothetical protein